MITDILLRRYPEIKLELDNSFFVQLFNIYDDYNTGIHRALLDKIESYPYSGYADEHIRMIDQAQKKLSNELGYRNLDKPEYKDLPDTAGGFDDYRIFKNYTFDASVDYLEKLSLFEVLFRDTEEHLKNEINFLEKQIPKYESQSSDIVERYKGKNVYNEGEEKLKKAIPQLERKKEALKSLQSQINQRLRLNKLGISYHNGFFQKSEDSLVEQKILEPFWEIIADPKYKNVEMDILEALDRHDSGGRDPALYAAKALESMLKIVCDDKGLTTGNETGAGSYISHLNSSKNGTIIINDEKEELLSMFRIRNSHGHGPGNDPMPTLTSQQTLRYIHSTMIWIHSLSKRLG